MKFDVVWGKSAARLVRFEDDGTRFSLLIGQRVDGWRPMISSEQEDIYRHFNRVMDAVWARRPWEEDWVAEVDRLACQLDEVATVIAFQATESHWCLTAIGQALGYVEADRTRTDITANVFTDDGVEYLRGGVGVTESTAQVLTGTRFEVVVVDLAEQRFRDSELRVPEHWRFERGANP